MVTGGKSYRLVARKSGDRAVYNDDATRLGIVAKMTLNAVIGCLRGSIRGFAAPPFSRFFREIVFVPDTSNRLSTLKSRHFFIGGMMYLP